MRATRIDQQQPAKTCPKCGSGDYQFRSRKKVPAASEKGEPGTTEMKYRCKACEHEWKVKAPIRAGA
jgi:hypothetical protein